MTSCTAPNATTLAIDFIGDVVVTVDGGSLRIMMIKDENDDVGLLVLWMNSNVKQIQEKTMSKNDGTFCGSQEEAKNETTVHYPNTLDGMTASRTKSRAKSISKAKHPNKHKPSIY